MCRAGRNGMKPRIQCVLTQWMSGFRASGSWRPGIQRDGAEHESAQIRTVFPGGLAPARRRLDGQDGQRPVDHSVLRGPSAQRLDDIGHVIRAGVRPVVSLPRPRAVQLNLETRNVQALVIRVACLRRRLAVRRNHASPGSPGAPQSNDAVIYGFSSLKSLMRRRPSRCDQEGPSPSMQ
jgi:hypothetical protein